MLTFITVLALAVAVIAAVPLVLGFSRARRRQRTLSSLLDLADEVERLLDGSQQRMQSLRPLVERVPQDIAAQAQASLEGGLPIMDAKRDVLQHRLWIQKNGQSASQKELDQAVTALDRARQRLAARLKELDCVGSDLAKATQAAAEAALREPPALRRRPLP